MLRVMIAQDEYFTKNGIVHKTGKLQTQTVNHDPKIHKNNVMEEQGYTLVDDGEKKYWERPKIGGIVEDNIMKVLGFVYDESKYDSNGQRKKENMIYEWK
jgi:hypothetical protein